MLRSIISGILFFSVVGLFGQVQIEEDTTRVRPPKPPKVKKEPEEFIPTSVKLGLDLNSFSRNLWDENKTFQEIQVDVDFRHYLLALEFGTAEVTEMSEAFSYQNKGSYYRVGPDINFLYKPEHHHAVFVGIRYASSTYDDELDYDTEDAFGTTRISSSNDNAKAQWAELVTGTKINIWKGLFIGFTIRYKFLKSVKSGDLEPYWIPGFGENRLDDNDQFGFSYYVWWRIGFGKLFKKELEVTNQK
jgi:hypothetical protein